MTDDIVNDAVDFHTTNTMLDQPADVRYPLVIGFLVIGQRSVAGLLLGLKDGHARQAETLEPTILPKHAPVWQVILRLIGNPFVVRFPCIGGA